MELEELIKLIDHVSKSKLDDFCYEQGDIKLRLRKKGCRVVSEAFAGAAAQSGSVMQEEEPQQKASCITSPLVGVFYTAPGEGAAPFVTKGDQVKRGQTLGIVEAMKLMHEITCDCDGVVQEICVSNGEAVEYGQKLFVIADGEK